MQFVQQGNKSLSFKILRIAGLNYSLAVDKLNSKFNNFADLTYADQQKHIFDLCLVYGDSFSKGMNRLGCDAHEIIHDVDSLQIAWARENNYKINFSNKNWKSLLVLEQIRQAKPEVVFFQDLHSLPSIYRNQIKVLAPSVKMIVLHKGYPSHYEELNDFDLILMSMPSLVDMCKSRGINADLHYHGFNTNVNKFVTNNFDKNSTGNYTFIGSSGFGHGDGHRTRYWNLCQLFNKTPLIGYIEEQFSNKNINFNFLKDNFISNKNYKASVTLLVKLLRDNLKKHFNDHFVIRKILMQVESNLLDYNAMPKFPIAQLFPNKCNPPVFGVEMYEKFISAQFTLNMHADATGDSVGNLRMFEATGVGACLLTNDGPNMKELFKKDIEVVTYKDNNDCLDKIQYLLANPRVCEEIGRSGQLRTLKDHTIEKRTEKLFYILKSNFK